MSVNVDAAASGLLGSRARTAASIVIAAANPSTSGAMDNLAAQVAAEVTRAIDFSGVGRVVDVGGASGTLVSAVLRTFPQTKGVLLDLAHVVEPAKKTLAAIGLSARCEAVAADFFKAVSELGHRAQLRAREWRSRSPPRPRHPGWLRCSSVTYQQYAPSSRLSSRAPRPRSSTDFAIPGPLALLRRRLCRHPVTCPVGRERCSPRTPLEIGEVELAWRACGAPCWPRSS
jgi:O-methyltransferase domain